MIKGKEYRATYYGPKTEAMTEGASYVISYVGDLSGNLTVVQLADNLGKYRLLLFKYFEITGEAVLNGKSDTARNESQNN